MDLPRVRNEINRNYQKHDQQGAKMLPDVETIFENNDDPIHNLFRRVEIWVDQFGHSSIGRQFVRLDDPNTFVSWTVTVDSFFEVKVRRVFNPSSETGLVTTTTICSHSIAY